MREVLVSGRTLPEAYHKSLWELSQETEIVPCDDWNTTQKEVSMTMVVTEPLAEPMISKLFIGGPRELEQYRQEMLDGILDFEVAKGNWQYTYHDRFVNYPVIDAFGGHDSIDQIRFVIRELERNPSSRRAVILVREVTQDAGSDDPACLQHIQYFIRNGKLECKVLFRSNDACKATFMNAFALIMLQKHIADELGVEMGTYTHRANSFHCYEKDFDMMEGYRGRIEKAEDPDDICFEYEGDWKEDMEAFRNEIAAMVNELRSRFEYCANKKTIEYNDVEAHNEDHKVVLTCLPGETDEEGNKLIRADLYGKCDSGEWEDETMASTCTGITAVLSVEEGKVYAEEILTRFAKGLKKNPKQNIENLFCMTI